MVGALVAVLVASVLLVHLAERAGADGDRCDRFASDSRARAATVSGSGEQVVVIGEPENIFQRGLCLSAMDVEGAMEALRWSAEHGERFGW